MFNIFIFYFHYLSIFFVFVFVNFRFLLLFLHLVFHFCPLLLKFFNLNQCLFLHSRPPCIRSTEYLLGPFTLIETFPSYLKKKNVSFDKNIGMCPTVCSPFLTAIAYLSLTRAVVLMSGTAPNSAPTSALRPVGMVAPDKH